MYRNTSDAASWASRAQTYLVSPPRLRHQDEHARFFGALERAPSLLPRLVVYPAGAQEKWQGFLPSGERNNPCFRGGGTVLCSSRCMQLAAPFVRGAHETHWLMAQASVRRSWCLSPEVAPDVVVPVCARLFKASGIGMVGMERSELPASPNVDIKISRRGHATCCVQGGTAHTKRHSKTKSYLRSQDAFGQGVDGADVRLPRSLRNFGGSSMLATES